MSDSPEIRLYAILIEERHSDAEVEIWTRPEEAIARAKSIAEDFSDKDDVDEYLTDGMRRQGWIYYATWSPEADSVTVIKTLVQGS